MRWPYDLAGGAVDDATILDADQWRQVAPRRRFSWLLRLRWFEHSIRHGRRHGFAGDEVAWCACRAEAGPRGPQPSSRCAAGPRLGKKALWRLPTPDRWSPTASAGCLDRPGGCRLTPARCRCVVERRIPLRADPGILLHPGLSYRAGPGALHCQLVRRRHLRTSCFAVVSPPVDVILMNPAAGGRLRLG